MPNFRLLATKSEVHFVTILGAVVCGLILFAFLVTHHLQPKVPSKPVVNQFNNLDLTAKAAYVLDVRTGKVLFAKNADERLPLASLVKVMTAVTASDLAPSYSRVTITPEAVATNGDSGLLVGEVWSLKNLLDFSLTSSSNDGARAVGLTLGALNKSNASSSEIEADFIREMNAKADSLGMKNTYFFNDTGLDQSPKVSGAYGSARDMGTLLTYILNKYPELMAATREPLLRVSSNLEVHLARNTDSLVSYIPGVKASKTGYTDLAGGNLVVAFDPEIGRPIVVAVLGSTEEGRFNDMIKLVNASLKTIQSS